MGVEILCGLWMVYTMDTDCVCMYVEEEGSRVLTACMCGEGDEKCNTVWFVGTPR